jgi:hypothetical protein
MTAAKIKPFIFSVWGFALPNIAYIFILMIMNDFCLSSAFVHQQLGGMKLKRNYIWGYMNKKG